MKVTTGEIPTRVLILGMARVDGTISMEELGPVAETCGQTPEQVRSCLRRLVSERLLTREGTGRLAIYHPTEAGTALMGSVLQRHRLAYLQDSQGRGWDQRWRLVAFNVPEPQRAQRDQLRDRLLGSGGAAIGNGLYVSVHAWNKDVRDEAATLGLSAHVTLVTTDDLEVGGVRDVRELARTLWPVDDLALRYQEFLDEHEGVVPVLEELRRRRERISDSDFLPRALAMVTAFNEVFFDDPLLPPELLPRPWPGRKARDLLVKSRRLALRVRAVHERPALFRAFDDLIASIP